VMLVSRIWCLVHYLSFKQVLKCPKSNVKLVQGFKSRDKTIAISGMDTNGDPQSVVSNIKKLLQNAIDS